MSLRPFFGAAARTMPVPGAIRTIPNELYHHHVTCNGRSVAVDIGKTYAAGVFSMFLEIRGKIGGWNIASRLRSSSSAWQTPHDRSTWGFPDPALNPFRLSRHALGKCVGRPLPPDAARGGRCPHNLYLVISAINIDHIERVDKPPTELPSAVEVPGIRMHSHIFMLEG